MAERVVDPLEIIQIEIKNCQHPLVDLRCLEDAVEATARLLPIRKTGQCIEIGELDDAMLGPPLARQ